MDRFQMIHSYKQSRTKGLEDDNTNLFLNKNPVFEYMHWPQLDKLESCLLSRIHPRGINFSITTFGCINSINTRNTCLAEPREARGRMHFKILAMWEGEMEFLI